MTEGTSTRTYQGEWFFRGVPRLGNVAVSNHAQARLIEWGVTPAQFEQVLFRGAEVPDGFDVVWRSLRGIRAVILLNPIPDLGAKLVKTVYKVQPQAKVR